MEASKVVVVVLAGLLVRGGSADTDIKVVENVQTVVAPQKSYPPAAPDAPVDYTGSQVWKITSDGALPIIHNLTAEDAINVWGGNRSHVDVLVKPEQLTNVAQVMAAHDIPYEVMIQDLQRNIEEENPPLTEEQTLLQNRQGHRLTWLKYHRVQDIYGFLDYLAATYPEHCSLKTVGKSYEGREMKLLKISNGKPGNKAVWIDGGIHAREWISPATVTYIINQLAENFDEESPEIQNIDWYIMPMLNPDGYEYTHTTYRTWRKNRHGLGPCAGVDLNRNFAYKWGGKGTSNNPCSEIYRGQKAFSELETLSVKKAIESSGANFKAYLSYHSYGQYLLYPWGYDSKHTTDHEDLQKLGQKMAEVIYQTGGSVYSTGVSSILLYPAAGGSDDWAYSKGIKYAYTVELADKGNHGFVLPAKYILPVAKESIAALRVLAKQVYSEN